MVLFLMIAFFTFLAALVQSTIGFGAAIIILNTIPYFLDVRLCMVISQASCIALSVSVLLRYRKSVRWKVLFPLLLPAMVLAVLGATASSHMDIDRLQLYLGFFFLVLSLYFAFFSDRIRLTPTPLVGFLVGCLSGTLSGFFSMGGPPTVLYLAPALEKKEEYLATSQLFFIITNSLSLTTRLMNGVADASVIPLVAVGMPCAILGTLVGGKVVGFIKPAVLKKLIYLMIGINGLLIMVKNLH